MSISMYENPQNLQSWADTGRQHASPLVKENFYQYQEHLKFVCILFSGTLNNFRSQITGVSDQSASWLVLETQECYATLWYSTSIFQFNNHLTCTHTPRDERGECREREIQGRWRGFVKYSKRNGLKKSLLYSLLEEWYKLYWDNLYTKIHLTEGREFIMQHKDVRKRNLKKTLSVQW